MYMVSFSAVCSDLPWVESGEGPGWGRGCGYIILSLIGAKISCKIWPRSNPVFHPALSVYELVLYFDYMTWKFRADLRR